MTTAPTLGVDHIGVGVSDMERSLAFWGRLGFTEIAFDHTGELGGLAAVAGYDSARARVVMLRPAHPSVLGPGAVKLVALDGGAPAMPAGVAWGEPGICEVCVHVRDQAALYRRLVAARVTSLMEPDVSALTPYGTTVSLSYVADPDATKIEVLEWIDLEAGWPEPDGPQGVNHVAFGVASIERTRAFYRSLGFTGMVFDSDGYFEPMHPWYAPREPPRQKMTLLTHPYGAGLEPVEHIPASPDMRGDYGHLGPFDFGIGARNLELALAHLQGLGIDSSPVHAVDLGGGASWRYAYFAEPDGNPRLPHRGALLSDESERQICLVLGGVALRRVAPAAAAAGQDVDHRAARHRHGVALEHELGLGARCGHPHLGRRAVLAALQAPRRGGVALEPQVDAHVVEHLVGAHDA